MKNGWRTILMIAGAAILLGCVCVGVGMLTGADKDRIILNLNTNYGELLKAYTYSVERIIGWFGQLI